MYSITHPPTEAKATALLRSCVWADGRPRCPRCRTVHVRGSEDRYHCRRCRRKFSLYSGTWLTGCRLSPRTLWKLIWCWQQGYAPGQMAELSGVSPQCVSRILPRLRAHLPRMSPKLAGIVEVDETCVGHTKHGGQRWVMGTILRSSPRKIALRLVADREQETTDRFLLDHVSQRSLVITDGWQAYRHIEEFFGYGHRIANHERGDLGPTNRIESLWSAFDRWRLRQYGTPRRSHLQGIVWEYQARISTPEFFDSPLSFLKNALSAVPRG